MTDPSPYQPPSPAGFPPPLALAGRPGVVSVFGILHVVFACLGILMAAWGLYIAVAGNPFLGFTPPGPQRAMQAAMQAKINPMTITSSILSLVVAAVMISAGIKLLKRRENALSWSNGYAYSSLAAKAVNLFMTVTIMLPAMNEMTRSTLGGSHMPGAAEGVLAGMMAGGAIGGVVVSCVYPILTLASLNRPPVRQWLTGRPD